MWVVQCSLASEVLQDGFEYVLELIDNFFGPILSSWSSVCGHFEGLEGVWGSFCTPLE